MWKLIYEDTFGFGEDRDPPIIDAAGSDDSAGFIKLWESVINESVTGTKEKPVEGFASFTLVLTDSTSAVSRITINISKYLYLLAEIKSRNKKNDISKIALWHYEAFLANQENKFWEELRYPLET